MSRDDQRRAFEEELSDEQKRLLVKLAHKVVEMRMTTPAILFLESVRPMNYVGSQVMVFFAPLVRSFFGLPEWDELQRVLEHRESVAYFLDLIDEEEAEYDQREQERKQIAREARKAAGGGWFRRTFMKKKVVISQEDSTDGG